MFPGERSADKLALSGLVVHNKNRMFHRTSFNDAGICGEID